MPSSTIDFVLSDVCVGGGHGTITMRQDTVPIGSRRMGIMELKTLAADSDTNEVLMAMAVEIVKAANPPTLADLKTLINNMTIVVEW